MACSEELLREMVALRTARQQKQRNHPELSGHKHHCRLVVLATEIGGLSKPALNHHSCAEEWNKHGGCGGSPVRALASSLVEWGVGADGDLPCGA